MIAEYANRFAFTLWNMGVTELENNKAVIINCYNEYKEYEVGKGQVKYAVFAGHLKKQFKIAPTRTLYNLHIDKFDELVDYIHSRIDGTKLAKVKGRGHKNYSTYDEFFAGQK